MNIDKMKKADLISELTAANAKIKDLESRPVAGLKVKGEPKVSKYDWGTIYMFEVGTENTSIWLKTVKYNKSGDSNFLEYKDQKGSYRPLVCVKGDLRNTLLELTK